jgi:hypothetical protein
MTDTTKSIAAEQKQNIVKAYQTFYDRSLAEYPSALTPDEVKAIGQMVYSNLIEETFEKQDIPEKQRALLRAELEQLLREECAHTFWDTPLQYRDEGFQRKER